MQHYWGNKEQELINTYYYCYTASTSAQTRNKCVNQLYPALLTLTKNALNSYQLMNGDYNEKTQECLIHLTTHVMPKLKEDKLKGTLNYLWLSTRNYIINNYLIKKKIYYDDVCSCTEGNVEDEIIETEELQELRKSILNELDKRIIEQHVMNKSNSILLELLKIYLTEQNFNPEGFKEFVKEKMCIRENTYINIMSRLRIKRKVFENEINN
jgi:hypothetical protein